MFGKKLMAKAAKPMMLAGALAAFSAVLPAQAAGTTYNVTETFNQVVFNASHPDWDTLFTGSFTYDSATQTVSNLKGKINQAMDGAPGSSTSAWVDLTNQLSSVAVDTSSDGINDGLVVSVFKNNSVGTFLSTNGPFTGDALGGTAGNTFGSNAKMGPVFTNGTQNAFVSIFVPFADPTAALTLSQSNYLAYGDCTPAALMPRNGSGDKCMAGWNAYNASGNLIPGGTMQGTLPNTQTITAVPEPETYAMMMAGLGLLGFLVRRRRAK